MKFVKQSVLYKNLIKKAENRVLALDIGKVFTGVAISKAGHTEVVPLDDEKLLPDGVLLCSDRTMPEVIRPDVIHRLQQIIHTKNVIGIVAGYPLDMHGRDTNKSAKDVVRPFMKFLEDSNKFEGIDYTYWNESFTTSEGVNRLKASLRASTKDLQEKEQRIAQNQLAATNIGRVYLDAMRLEAIRRGQS